MALGKEAEVNFLPSEKVAYWYFRLNGYLQIENFVIHPGGRGGQRTDGDLLGVRFPNRREFLLDHRKPMQDDSENLRFEQKLIDVVIVEIKTNKPCRLNGPWTSPELQNIQRILAAIGCLPIPEIFKASDSLYKEGAYKSDCASVRLIAVGNAINPDPSQVLPKVIQITWPMILGFIWKRFVEYRRQKSDTQQWDEVGNYLKSMAISSDGPDQFSQKVMRLMGVSLSADASTSPSAPEQ